VIQIVRALAVLVLLALHIPVSAHANSILDDLIVGSEVTGRLKVGMVTVPLPSGSWTVVNVNEKPNNQFNTTASTDLIRLVNGKAAGWLNISTNLDLGRSGWQLFDLCSRKDIWFLQNDANYESDQRCWGVNYWVYSQTATYTPTRGVNLQQWLINHDATMPGIGVYSFYRFADQGKFLNYRIHENPELAGFAPEPGITWENSAWHPDVVSKDPPRVAYLEQFKARYAGIYPELSRQFR
jgi:hypothetical protein